MLLQDEDNQSEGKSWQMCWKMSNLYDGLRARAAEFSIQDSNGTCLVCEDWRHSWRPLSKLLKHSKSSKHRIAMLMRSSANSRTISPASTASGDSKHDDPASSDAHSSSGLYDRQGLEVPIDSFDLGEGELVDDGTLFGTGGDTLISAAELEALVSRELLYYDVTDPIPAQAPNGAINSVPSQGTWSVAERMNRIFGVGGEDDHFPWPNEGMLYANVMYCSSRTRFSLPQERIVYEFAESLGGSGVPTLSGREQFQKECLKSMGDPVRRFMALHGSVYYLNDLAVLLAQ
ncbi:hypothetical protein CALCODRAFT_541973, partial [Calocera cornea HHB12733]